MPCCNSAAIEDAESVVLMNARPGYAVPSRTQTPESGHETARTRALFRDRRSSAVEISRRRPPRHLAGGESRSVADRKPDGAPDPARAHGRPAASARRAELELARIRHAGRRMALLRRLRQGEGERHARDQR